MGQHAHLYRTARWQRIRKAQLAREPLCRYCQQMGRVVAATICDHITPHKGDVVAFYAGPFQSLCKPCHDGAKQQLERRGALRGCGADGLPLDARHHWSEGDASVARLDAGGNVPRVELNKPE